MKNYIFPEDEESQKGRWSWATRAHTLPGAGHPGPRHQGVWPPWPTSCSTLLPIYSPRNPNTRRATTEGFHHLSGAETREREKELSGRQISAGEIPSLRGEIVAINTVLK